MLWLVGSAWRLMDGPGIPGLQHHWCSAWEPFPRRQRAWPLPVCMLDSGATLIPYALHKLGLWGGRCARQRNPQCLGPGKQWQYHRLHLSRCCANVCCINALSMGHSSRYSTCFPSSLLHGFAECHMFQEASSIPWCIAPGNNVFSVDRLKWATGCVPATSKSLANSSVIVCVFTPADFFSSLPHSRTASFNLWPSSVLGGWVVSCNRIAQREVFQPSGFGTFHGRR